MAHHAIGKVISRPPWFVSAILIIPILFILYLIPSSQASDSCRPTPWEPPSTTISASMNLAIEAAGRGVAEVSRAKHALGYYFDSSASQFVVVVPTSGPGSELSLADFTTLNVPVRVEYRGITQTTIDTISQRIRQLSWHPDASRYFYGFDYDARRGIIDLRTDAPPEVVAPLMQAYPCLIEYHQGVTVK